MNHQSNSASDILNQSGKRTINHTQIGLIVLGLTCALAIWINWLKIDMLGFDAGRGFFEAYRLAQGQLPYRDFMLQYPPLSTWLLGYAFRLFGSTFITAQAVLDVISAAVVLLTWRLARRLVPDLLALAVAVAWTIQGVNHASLFSLTIWTPAVLTGMTGILLFMLGVVDYLQTGTLTRSQTLKIGLGALISLLSKQEFMLGTMVGLATLGLVDLRHGFHGKPLTGWLRQYILLSAVAIGPSLIAYLALGSMTGMDNLIAGLTGYGQAAVTCPWWPTGFGLVSGLAALGVGATVIVLFSLPWLTVLRRRYRWRYIALWAIAIVGAIGFPYFALNYFPLTATYQIPLERRLNALTSPSMALLPVLWYALPVWGIQTKRVASALFQNRTFPTEASQWYVLLTTALALTARSLFGTHWYNGSSVAIAAFPLLLIVGAHFLLQLQQTFESGAAPTQAVETSGFIPPFRAATKLAIRMRLAAVAIAAFAGLHLTIIVVKAIWAEPYRALNTEAGPVAIRLKDERWLYDYVVSHTADQDLLLSVSYEVINFAAHRTSPVFATQFSPLAPDRKYLDRDLQRIQQNPPRIVIADDHPYLGAGYGGSDSAYLLRCPFPALVWSATEPAYSLDTPIPVVEYVRSNYQPEVQFGQWIVYTPRSAPK